MAERSRPWSGTVTGDAGPYSDDQWTNAWKTLLGPVIASQGVFQDQLNDLNLSGLPASPVTIESGRALVDGTWYETDASVSVAIPTPAINPRVDRIVLRKTWATQVVRVARIAGVENAIPAPPAVSQVDGVLWDLPLWQVFISVGGVIAYFRDERDFIGQYEPVGLSDTNIHMEWDFYCQPIPANHELLGPFQVDLVGGFTIQAISEAGFSAGGIAFIADGAGVGGIARVHTQDLRPDQINAHLKVRSKQPDTDAALDRSIGFSPATSLTPNDGVFFRSDGTGNWFAVCRAGGVEVGSVTDTGQALDDVWRTFEIRQVEDDVVTFLIDDVVVATNC